LSDEKSLQRQQRLQVMLNDVELKAIDAWRFKHRMPSRAAAIRQLIRRGLLTSGDLGTILSENNAAVGKSADFGIIEIGDDPNVEMPPGKLEPSP
jgi:hypothetical protein